MRIIRGLLLTCLICTAGCGSDDGDDQSIDVGSGTLSGKVGGKSWTFVAGGASPLFVEEDTFYTDLYAAPLANACQNGPSSRESHIILNVPMKAGDYRLGLGLTATFVIESDGGTTNNLGATRGRLVVDEVTDASVRGKAHVIFDADNEVDGAFEVTRCP
jgi:hypothetical protein